MEDQNGELLHPVTIAEPNRKKKDFFPDKNSAYGGHGLFVYQSPPNLLFASIKAFSFSYLAGTCTWLTMVADPKLKFSVDPK